MRLLVLCFRFRVVSPVSEFCDDSEEKGGCPEATNTPPTRNVPAQCAQVGAKPAANEVAEHVNHVEPAPGVWVDIVDAGLVGNVPALHAQIHQDDSDNQASEMFAGKAQEKEGEQG
jgi:hypothetical protein